MDVYSAYQDQYLGTVIEVTVEGTASGGGPQSGAEKPNPTGSEQPPANIQLVHEEGARTGHSENRGTHQLGEEMGPVPTIALGNGGPQRQSAADAYATGTTFPPAAISSIRVRPGRLNLGPLTRSFRVPVSAIRSISMERIVLDVQQEQIPADWRR